MRSRLRIASRLAMLAIRLGLDPAEMLTMTARDVIALASLHRMAREAQRS